MGQALSGTVGSYVVRPERQGPGGISLLRCGDSIGRAFGEQKHIIIAYALFALWRGGLKGRLRGWGASTEASVYIPIGGLYVQVRKDWVEKGCLKEGRWQ